MSDEQLLTEFWDFLEDNLLRLWIQNYIEGSKDENGLVQSALDSLEKEDEAEEH